MRARPALPFTLLILGASGCGAQGACWLDLTHAPLADRLFLVSDQCGTTSGLLELRPSGAQLLHAGVYSRLATNAQGDVRVASTGSRQLRRLAPGDAATTGVWYGHLGEVAVTPSGEAVWMALWGGESGVMLLDADRLTAWAYLNHPGDPVALELSGDGRRLAIASSQAGTLRLLDAVALQDLATTPTNGALALAFTPGGELAVLEDLERQVRLFDADLRPLATLAAGAQPRQLAVSPAGTRLVVTEAAEGALLVFDLAARTEVARWPLGPAPRAVVLVDEETAVVGLEDEGRVVQVNLHDGAMEDLL